MLHAGLDLSRRKVDVCLLSSAGEIVDEWASPPDADGLRGLAARAGMWGQAVRGVIESMNGARFVHDRLEEHGWDVLIADATKVKGLAPLACTSVNALWESRRSWARLGDQRPVVGARRLPPLDDSVIARTRRASWCDGRCRWCDSVGRHDQGVPPRGPAAERGGATGLRERRAR
jgi:hypothetical protein